MDIEILCRPAASAAKISLNAGEVLTAEAGAMIAMSSDLEVKTTTQSRGKGGVLKGLKRMLSGESFFLNHFTATRDAQELFIGPALMGDVMQHRLDNATLICQGSSWLASGPGIEVDSSWQGLGKALFSGEGAFWVKCSGTGELLLNSFGAIYEVEVTSEYIVDTGHVVAFEDTLDFSIGKPAQTWLDSFLGGEGMVCRFKGQGRLYCQTHNLGSFGSMLGPRLKAR